MAKSAAKTKGAGVVDQKVIEDPVVKSSPGTLFGPFVGSKVAVLCARYQYRGFLSEIHEFPNGGGYLVIADATSVEISGATNNPTPEREDPIGGSIQINVDAIELFYQPRWCSAPLPSEDGYGGGNS